MNENKEISVSGKADTEILTLVGAAIGLSAYAWDLSFNFGAFGVIFMGHIMALWLFSLSIILLTVVVQRQFLPGNKWWGYFMLSLPTIWLVLRIVDDSSRTGQITDQLIHVASILALVISLPYLVYLFFYFTNPSMIHLKRRIIAGLVGIMLLIALIGYTLGSYNYLIMSCENFIVSGQDTPQNCIKEKTPTATSKEDG
ncbi:MAG: hypothetical protein GY869_03725 [Planctomycetes bacterium]|nr:hypothetical protein [Planctomycetota bacterium]